MNYLEDQRLLFISRAQQAIANLTLSSVRARETGEANKTGESTRRMLLAAIDRLSGEYPQTIENTEYIIRTVTAQANLYGYTYHGCGEWGEDSPFSVIHGGDTLPNRVSHQTLKDLEGGGSGHYIHLSPAEYVQLVDFFLHIPSYLRFQTRYISGAETVIVEVNGVKVAQIQPAQWLIESVSYTSIPGITSFSLQPQDLIRARIDLIAGNKEGSIVYVPGTLSAIGTAVKPLLLDSQVELRSITVLPNSIEVSQDPYAHVQNTDNQGRLADGTTAYVFQAARNAQIDEVEDYLTLTPIANGGQKLSLHLGEPDLTEGLPVVPSTSNNLIVSRELLDQYLAESLDLGGFVFTADIPVSLSGGKTLGKFVHGSTIPSKGKNPQEVWEMAAIEAIYPTYTLPTITLAQSAAAIGEVGALVNNTLTATFSQNDAGNLSAIRIAKAGVDMTPNGSTNTFPKTESVRRIAGNIAYQAYVNYLAGALKTVPPANTPDDRPALVRSVNAPQAAGDDFASAVVNLVGIYPYFYGKVTSATRPTPGQALLDTGTKSVAASTGTLTINFNSGSGDFIWFAIPSASTSKTTWYVNALNTGTIGGAVSEGGNLFAAATTANIDSSVAEVIWSGISYKIYLSNYRTAATSNMELRN